MKWNITEGVTDVLRPVMSNAAALYTGFLNLYLHILISKGSSLIVLLTYELPNPFLLLQLVLFYYNFHVQCSRAREPASNHTKWQEVNRQEQ